MKKILRLLFLCFIAFSQFFTLHATTNALNGVPNLLGLQLIPPQLQDTNINLPCTKEIAAMFMTSTKCSYYIIRDSFFGKGYPDASSFYAPYADYAAQVGILEPLNSNAFGAQELMDKEEYLAFFLEELGHDVSSTANIFDLAITSNLLTDAEANKIKNESFSIGNASYIYYKALITIPKNKPGTIWIESLVDRKILSQYELASSNYTYKAQLQSRYYEMTKTHDAPSAPTNKIPAYIEGVSDVSSSLNTNSDLIAYNDKLYYIVRSNASMDVQILEFNPATSKSRVIYTLYDYIGNSVCLLRIVDDYLYFLSSHSPVLSQNIGNGVQNMALTQINLKTLEKLTLYDKRVNVLTGNTGFYITDKYIFCEEQSRRLYVLNRNGKKGTWKQLKSASTYKDFYQDITVDFKDNCLYATRQNGKTSYVVKIDAKGKETKCPSLNNALTTNLSSYRGWVYSIPEYGSYRLNTRTGVKENINYAPINLHYPWLYYISPEGPGRILLGHGTAQEPVYLPAAVSNPIFYKDKAYYIENIYNNSLSVQYFIIKSVDLNTFEVKEVHNAKNDFIALINNQKK